LDQYFPKRSYGIVYRKGKFLSPQAKRFIEMMEATFAETEKPANAKTS
jgi:LysR family transcriptional regulator, low CO2-responsive transcriptional regulator